MKAVLLVNQAGTKQLTLADVPTPTPQAGEIRIRVEAIGFNPSDVQMRERAALDTLPITLGAEVAGVVDAIGEGVTGFTLGEAVYAYLPLHRNAYAEYVCIEAVFAARRPAHLTALQCAGIPLVAITAYQALLAPGRLQPHESIFIAGGAGGVGTCAIQMARIAGASQIITTAGSDQSVQYLTEQLQMQPEQIIRYQGHTLDELKAKVWEANGGQPVDVALDCVGGQMTSLCCAVIGFEGAVLSIVQGPSDAQHSPNSDEDVLFSKAASFHFILAYARAEYGNPALWAAYRQELQAITRLIEAGQLAPISVTSMGHLSVETVQQAHTQLATGHTQGKLVMTTQAIG